MQLTVADLSDAELIDRLKGPGLRLRTGRIVSSVRTTIRSIVAAIRLHYARHPVEPPDGFADFHVRVAAPAGLRGVYRPQAVFHFEGASTFNPLPYDQAFPMLEWGLNWCVTAHCNQYVIVHAAVVERGGRAVLMPAPPGSGKSTLCAALVARGWRLLSDELALIVPATREVDPLPRPIGLKNASIDVIAAFAPGATIGTRIHETTKGTVAHMAPPAASVELAFESAKPCAIVFPRYVPGSAATLAPLGKATAFMRLVDNTFNYDVHGRRAFEALGAIVDTCACYEFAYARLDEAMAAYDTLAAC